MVAPPRRNMGWQRRKLPRPLQCARTRHAPLLSLAGLPVPAHLLLQPARDLHMGQLLLLAEGLRVGT